MYRLVLFFFLFTITPLAYANELFIPSDMLISENYRGVFIRDDSKEPQIITLVSDSDIIDVPDSLYMAPDQNHAIFDILLHGFGDATVIAHDDDIYYNATTSIVTDQKKDYNIFLLLPEKTSTSDVQGMVFLVDDFFNPIYPEQDVFVKFATQNIDVPKQLQITAGNSHAFFSANIAGDGTITAYTDSSTSDTVYIDYSMAQKEVHIGIAPYVIAPYSFAYLFVWLTENGVPLEPVLPIKSTLHVSDGDIIGIDGFSGSSNTVYLREGFLMKKITTNDPGESSITINVPGYGTASKTISVSNLPDSEQSISEQALLNGCDIDLIGAGYTGCDVGDSHPTSREQYIRNLRIVNTPDTIVANIFPTITSDSAYLVWSLYKDVNSKLFPTYGDVGTDFFITSQNLIHDNLIHFENDQRQTQSQIIPIYGSVLGNHTISISSTVTLDTATTELQITSPAKYDMSIQSLPSIDTIQDRPLFAVSVLDSAGYVINPHVTFGDLQVTLLSDDIQFAKKSIYLDKAINIIKGKSAISYPTITILANDRDIITSNSYKPTSSFDIDIQMPKTVHSGEKFPAYAFLTDSDGQPISDIREHLQSKCDDEDGLFSCEIDSKFILFENAIGFAAKTLPVFNNQFEYDDISFELGNDSIGIGSEFVIPYTIPSGATINVVTSIPHIINDDYITLLPDYLGNYDVSFLVSKPGFETHHANTSYYINDGIALTIQSVTTDGVSIPSSVSISHKGQTVMVSAPGDVDIPRGDMHFEFKSSLIIDSTGYSFDHVTISGIQYDFPVIDISLLVPADISVTYGRVINIVTGNANGGGVYDYGETVTISAPPRDVVGFLIRDVFDYWEYLPSGYDVYSDIVIITATESFSTGAVYRPDYSGLVLSVVGIVLLMFVFIKRDRILSIIKTYRTPK